MWILFLRLLPLLATLLGMLSGASAVQVAQQQSLYASGAVSSGPAMLEYATPILSGALSLLTLGASIYFGAGSTITKTLDQIGGLVRPNGTQPGTVTPGRDSLSGLLDSMSLLSPVWSFLSPLYDAIAGRMGDKGLPIAIQAVVTWSDQTQTEFTYGDPARYSKYRAQLDQILAEINRSTEMLTALVETLRPADDTAKEQTHA